MKKLIFTSLGLLLCLGSFAQPYKSYFGEEYTKWYVYHSGCDGGWFRVYLSCSNSTEEIDGITYNYLFSLYSYYDYSSITVPDNSVSTVCLRENRNTGQLFLRFRTNDGFSPEIILSDMSLEVGDSIRLYGEDAWDEWNTHYYSSDSWQNVIFSEEGMPYAKVDSIYYLNDLKHIRTSVRFWNVLMDGYSFDNLMFIETIGSNIGPLFNMDLFSPVCTYIPALTCYETESKLVHSYNYNQDDCYWRIVGINNLKKELEVRAEFNNNILNLFFDMPFTGQINLVDCLGRTLYKNNISNQTNLNIETNGFSKGMYILQIRNTNNEIFNKKIIIF